MEQAGASVHYCVKHSPVEDALGIWKVIFIGPGGAGIVSNGLLPKN